MANTCEALDTCNISPVRSKLKHETTPMRTRRKTSRREQGIDVHTSSTPTANRNPRLTRSSQNSPRYPGFSSPSSSFPCSQDNHPEVVWDFTSPILPKGSKKKELKLTVQELLENLNQCQTPECNTQSSTYIKLLETWMSKQPVEKHPVVNKVQHNKNNKEQKKRSRRRIEELTKLINSIQKPQVPNTEPETSSLNKCGEHEVNFKPAESNTSFKNSFLEGGSTDDSSEELWGDVDNSFIIKATQVIDKVTAATIQNSGQATGLFSTVPDSQPNEQVPAPKSPIKIEQSHPCEQHSDILNQLNDIDWDLDGDDEWENGFLVEDDDLSLIPDEVLSGKFAQVSSPATSGELPNKIASSASEANTGITKQREVRTLKETQVSVVVETVPSAELFNSFEDDSFEDESLLCQPDVLSRIDEVESSMLSSQPKCTPDEIKRKKEEAIQRRKKNQLKKKK